MLAVFAGAFVVMCVAIGLRLGLNSMRRAKPQALSAGRQVTAADLQHLSAGLARLVTQLQITRESLVGYLDDVGTTWTHAVVHGSDARLGPDDDDATLDEAHVATANSDRLLWDLADEVGRLNDTDRYSLKGLGFDRDRMSRLIDRNARPSRPAVRRAIQEIDALVSALVGAGERDPYRNV